MNSPLLTPQTQGAQTISWYAYLANCMLRWGQAAAVVDDVLFVQGGRTDKYNQYAYSSAPPVNDMLALPLTSSFSLSSAPWDYVSGCSNCSSTQGPAVAWHTISPLNTSCLLVFGGDLGPNSLITQPEQPDSVSLVNIASISKPVWDIEPENWAKEPLRRMYHSASTSGGKVYIVGGQKTDGSGNAFATHYVFDPSGPSFSQLPSTNSPPAIYGHTSIVLTDGRLLVFGGYNANSSQLVPFTTIWSLCTTCPSPSWSTVSVNSGSVPNGRRGFAAALVDGGKVVIQGGADEIMQTVYSDGFILDTTQDPMVWSEVSTLSELGARRDHFAAGLGPNVLFGFGAYPSLCHIAIISDAFPTPYAGYGSDGSASTDLFFFDSSKGMFASSYTPPSAVTSPTATTLSGPQPTYTRVTNSGTGPGQGSATSGGDGSGGSANPAATGSGNGNGSGSGSGSGDPAGDSPSSHHTTSIALGTVFGVLGLLVGAGAAVWYYRRSHSHDRFHPLAASGDTDDLDGDLPMAGRYRDKPIPVGQSVRDRLSTIVPGLAASGTPQNIRKDMLADEDTRYFDTSPGASIHRDTSTGGSSRSSAGRRPTWGSVMHGSLASLRSVGGAMLGYAAGHRSHSARREASTSHSWREKHAYSDDPSALLMDNKPARPRDGRHPSDVTMASSRYDDPFADYDVESLGLAEYLISDDEDGSVHGLDLDDPPPLPYAYIRPPQASFGTVDLTRLSPVSEQLSIPTMSRTSASDTSHGASSTPVNNTSSPSHSGTLVPDPSRSSHDSLRSPLPARPSSILDANPSEPMRRSNSWWVRFAKTPLLDRRTSDRRSNSVLFDFRDPLPHPPALPLIAESAPSDAAQQRRVYARTSHGRSASSLQTAKTADSEMIEKMGRTMDIVQKGTVSSHSSGASIGESSVDEGHELVATQDARAPTRTRSLTPVILEDGASPAVVGLRGVVASPTEISPAHTTGFPFPPTSPRAGPARRPTSGQVVARVQAYERRMSGGAGDDAPARKRDRASVYTVAPRPPLFVANPDHRQQGSGDSGSTT